MCGEGRGQHNVRWRERMRGEGRGQQDGRWRERMCGEGWGQQDGRYLNLGPLHPSINNMPHENQ